MISRQLQIAILVLAVAILGAGIYAVRLKHQAEQLQNTHAVTVAPPSTGNTADLTLWLGDDGNGTLYSTHKIVALSADPAQRAQQALHLMLALSSEKDSLHPLPAGADVRSVYLLNNNSAVVDLNAPFAEQHRSSVEVEQLTVYSLVRTLASAAPNVTRVHILVDGKERETLAGHVDLKGWLDVAQVVQASEQLSGSR